MPFDGPAAGIGSAMLNRLNLSDDEVAKDFAFELRRCVTNEDYARWAKKWGEMTAQRLLEDGITGSIEDNEQFQTLSSALTDLTEAADDAADAVAKAKAA